MSQIIMSSTYESNHYGVVHMSQITMSSTWVKLLWVVHMSQITMSSTYESNYYE